MINPQPGDESRSVVYLNHMNQREKGVLTSWNDYYVFVRYDEESSSKATRRVDLHWEESADGD